MAPNYEQYTLNELIDALEHIDKDAYPHRVADIQRHIAAHTEQNKAAQRNSSNTSVDSSLDPIIAEKYNQELPTSNWLLAYWRGQYSLPVSYWLVGIAVSLLIYALNSKIETSIEFANSRVELGLYIFLLYALLIPLVVWQGVGVYRSANRHPYRGGSQGWASVAKTITVIGAVGFGFSLFTSGIPALKEAVSLVTEEHSYPPLTLRLLNQGRELELYGGIEVGSEVQLEQALESNPDITTLHLHSVGGRILGAARMAELVRKYQLNTYVKTRCASACTIIYLAGKQRLIGEEGQLAFHAASLGGSSTHDNHPLSGTLREHYENADVPEWFLKRVFATPNHELWTPSHQELLKAGIVDTVVNSNAYAFSGIEGAENIKQGDIDEGLLTHAYMRAIKQHDNPTYQKIIQFNMDGMREGSTINQISANINALLKTRINYYISHASDEAAVAYWQVLIAQMEALRTDTPLTCASFAFPDTVPLDYHYGNQGFLSQHLIDAEFAAMAGLISSFEAAPVLLTQDVKQALVLDIIEAVKADNPIYFDAIRTPEAFLERPAMLCQAAISLNKNFIAVPSHSRGPLLRTINAE